MSARDATAVHQVAESLDLGDGVSNIVRRMAVAVRDLGGSAEILSRSMWVPAELAPETRPPEAMLATSSPALIFHYWGYNSCTWMLDATPARTALWYHNITPPSFFAPELPQHWMTRQGYAQLSAIASRFDLLIGVSRYNIASLTPYLRRPRPSLHVYPVIEAADERAAPVDEALRARLAAEPGTKLLFIGRIARNKRQDDLLRAFDVYRRKYEPTARLWLVGNDECDPPYRAELEALRRSLPSGDAVAFTGKVSEEALRAYLLTGDVLLCASEHEGFCLPVAQAMALDMPVVARASAAVPETLGGGGVQLAVWDPARVADAIAAVRPGGPEREAVIARQHVAAARFSFDEAYARLDAVVRFLRTGEESRFFEWVRPAAWESGAQEGTRGVG